MTVIRPGVYTALVTPFQPDAGSIDWEAFERLIDGQIQGGITGLVPVGTTGESPTLSDSEQREPAHRTVKLAAGRASVFVGTGPNDTKKTIHASRAALEAGADGVMLVTPYYSRPAQEGLYRHVVAVARDVGAPIILYNIPARTGVELTIDTLLRILVTCPNVIGLKDASGNVHYCQDLLSKTGDRITVLSGDDPLVLPLMSVGAAGVISVTSNLYPRAMTELVEDALAGRYAEARPKNQRLLPVHRALFSETNPQPIKAALSLQGRMNGVLRLPLIEACAECRARLPDVMRAFEGA